MKSQKLNLASALMLGTLVGAGGSLAAIKLVHKNEVSERPPKQKVERQANLEDVMGKAWEEFDHSMAEQRQAMRKLFAAQVPDADPSWAEPDQGEVNEGPKQMVIRVPVQDPHHSINVKVKDGFVTVTEQAQSKSKDEVSDFDSVHSFSVNSEYDTSQMTQNLEGKTLVISIPKGSA